MSTKKLSPSIFIGVSGKDIISFGSGQPDLPPPETVFKILPNFRSFKYGLIQGQTNLREALARQYPKSTDENFVVTNGASEALDLALRTIALLESSKKKRVLLPRPYYYTYPHLVRYAGMEPVYTDLIEGRIDFHDFKNKIKDCRAVIINSPSNPTGRVESMATLKLIEKLTNQLGVYVLSDEVYKDLIYIRENYLIKGPRVITINSFSKTYSMCGLRVGYLWSPDQKLVNDIIEMKTRTSMNTSILSQEMAFEALKTPQSYIDKQVKIWEQRRDLIYEGLLSLGLDLWKPEGAFYVLPKIANPTKFVWEMFKKHKVITYPGDWFGASDRVRFSYALDAAKIKEGLKRVKNYLKK
ncbi:MAG: pyridoxal phosphate-dependent aminotransferase [Patescibacteria group bacterium]